MLARRALLAAGHREVGEDEAELHVINTCCITSEAEGKSRQAVRRSLRSAGQVYVSGCAANLNAAQFEEIAPGVKVLQGAAEDVAVEVAGLVSAREGSLAAGLPSAPAGGCADLEHDVLARHPRLEAATRTRGSSRSRTAVTRGARTASSP